MSRVVCAGGGAISEEYALVHSSGSFYKGFKMSHTRYTLLQAAVHYLYTIQGRCTVFRTLLGRGAFLRTPFVHSFGASYTFRTLFLRAVYFSYTFWTPFVHYLGGWYTLSYTIPGVVHYAYTSGRARLALYSFRTLCVHNSPRMATAVQMRSVCSWTGNIMDVKNGGDHSVSDVVFVVGKN